MGDITITVRDGSRLDNRLAQVARQTGHSKAEVALEVLLDWLDEQDDVSEVLARSVRDEPTHSIEEVRKHLGQHDRPRSKTHGEGESSA